MNKIEIRKVGLFYHVFGDDAKILHFLFGYQIRDNRCGFPLNALNKVTNTLEDKKINYEVTGEKKQDFKNLNKYNKYLGKAQDKLEINERLNKILKKLNDMDKDRLYDLLARFEGLLNEE
jgi:hypothetical protein